MDCIKEVKELVNKVADSLVITAVHAQSQVMIANIRKQAIALVDGIQEEATIGAKAAVHGLDNTAMLNVLGGLHTESTASERVSDEVKPKKISAGMASRLISDLNRIDIIIKGNQNSSADKKLVNKMKTEILEILNELKIRVVPVDNPGRSAQNVKEKKEKTGKKKGRKGKGRTKTEETKTEEISPDMHNILTHNLEDKKKCVDISKIVAKEFPESATISAIAAGDEAIFLKIRELITPHTLGATAAAERKPKPQGQKR